MRTWMLASKNVTDGFALYSLFNALSVWRALMSCACPRRPASLSLSLSLFLSLSDPGLPACSGAATNRRMRSTGAVQPERLSGRRDTSHFHPTTREEQRKRERERETTNQLPPPLHFLFHASCRRNWETTPAVSNAVLLASRLARCFSAFFVATSARLRRRSTSSTQGEADSSACAGARAN